VAALGENLSEAAQKMAPTKKLNFYFPSDVEDGSIHIIVQAPRCKSSGWSHPLAEITDTLPYPMRSASQNHGLFDDNTDGDALQVGMQKKRRLVLKLLEGSETIYKSEPDPNSVCTG
jgi:hypothetical protein